jgi:hypothetical protein
MPAFLDPWLPDPDGDSPVPSARPAVPITVYRVEADGTTLTELPNVRCLAVEEHEGPAPPTALFRYVFDGRDPGAPQTVEQALSTLYTRATLPRLVEINDNLGVRATRPDGENVWIFHGPALTFSAGLGRNSEVVQIAATGIAKRLWDNPVPGALMRATDKPETANDVQTDVVAQFNPRGVANATPSTGDADGSTDFGYPTILDPAVTGTDANGNDYPRTFDLAMACAYLIYGNNKAQTYIKNLKRADLDALLVSRQPIDGVPFDPANPSTYTAGPIQAPDVPLTGKAWPALVHDLVKDSGFGTRFDLSSDSSGNPVTTFVIFLKQAATPKPLLLQERGSRFDPSQTNTQGCEVGRDLAPVVNRWKVQGSLKRYEASFVLAPGFPSSATDSASTAALAAFDKSKDAATDTGANHDAYRLWLLDEAGETHYANHSTSAIDDTATSLDDVLGAPTGSPAVPVYVKRRRPPIGTLFTPDATGKRLSYRLSISTNYSGAYPAVWDGTGQWQPVTGGFQLLKDRIGVWLSVDNPNKWNVGKSATSGDPFLPGS